MEIHPNFVSETLTEIDRNKGNKKISSSVLAKL